MMINNSAVMLDFGDIKSKEFKEQSTCLQLLYMFQDALRMLNQQYDNDKSVLSGCKRVTYGVCTIDKDSFIIRVRVYEIQDVSFPVYWFAAQSTAYRSVCPKSRSRIEVEYKKCAPSFVEVVYRLYVEQPLPF